jgi:hypothetical protein
VSRLLKQRQSGRISDHEWEQLLALQSHQEHLMAVNKEQREKLSILTEAIQNFSAPDESAQTILQLLCRVSPAHRFAKRHHLITVGYD